MTKVPLEVMTQLSYFQKIDSIIRGRSRNALDTYQALKVEINNMLDDVNLAEKYLGQIEVNKEEKEMKRKLDKKRMLSTNNSVSSAYLTRNILSDNIGKVQNYE